MLLPFLKDRRGDEDERITRCTRTSPPLDGRLNCGGLSEHLRRTSPHAFVDFQKDAFPRNLFSRRFLFSVATHSQIPIPKGRLTNKRLETKENPICAVTREFGNADAREPLSRQNMRENANSSPYSKRPRSREFGNAGGRLPIRIRTGQKHLPCWE